MEDQKSPLVIGFLIVGLLFVMASVYFSFRSPDRPDQSLRLARVERETGTVEIIRNGFTQKEKVVQPSSLFHLDSVETNETGEALLSFESAYRVKVLDNSIVTIEKNKSFVNLIVKKGDVLIDSYGREGELVISKNGEQVAASDYNGSRLSSAMVLSEPTPQPTRAISGLSEEEITAVMTSHGAFFKKCFTQLLQKDQKAHGQATLSFTIENSGKLSVVEVTSSTLTQEEFKKCLLDVMGRVNFKPFTGPAISTLFPLKFE